MAVAAWRLSQGPVDLAWLTHRLEAAANANGGPTRLSIGSTALAWEGFRLGVDRPLDLRLTDIRLTDTGGVRRSRSRAPRSPSRSARCCSGALQPRALELDDPRLTLRRAEDGTISIDLGRLTEQTEQSAGRRCRPDRRTTAGPARPCSPSRRPTDRNAAPGWFSQLRRVRIHDAVVTVVDRRAGRDWQAPQADVT